MPYLLKLLRPDHRLSLVCYSTPDTSAFYSSNYSRGENCNFRWITQLSLDSMVVCVLEAGLELLN